jgi:hypothetical protein
MSDIDREPRACLNFTHSSDKILNLFGRGAINTPTNAPLFLYKNILENVHFLNIFDISDIYGIGRIFITESMSMNATQKWRKYPSLKHKNAAGMRVT